MNRGNSLNPSIPVAFLAATLWSAGVTDAGQASEQFSHFKTLLSQHCTRCHGEQQQKASINFTRHWGNDALYQNRELWELAAEMLSEREMPPDETSGLSEVQRAFMIDFIQERLDEFDCADVSRPGRVLLRRLNRNEYINTVRDLFRTELKIGAELPVDPGGYGFDNVDEALSISGTLLTKYLESTKRIAREVVRVSEEQINIGSQLSVPTPKAGKELRTVRRLLHRLANRAYRRPASETEKNRLEELFTESLDETGSLENALELTVQAILSSPQFLFHLEIDSAQAVEAGTAVRRLNSYEVASRLSYFLWSSMPDETLFSLAEQGKLTDPRIIRAQTRRMLNDARFSAFVDNFTGQWLELRRFEQIQPDPDLFPEFDDALRHAMAKETRLFFEAIVRENRSILELIDADFAFVNGRLAKHYGIPGVDGNSFRRIALSEDSPLGGVLTQGSILTLTSHPNRTSPVNRGKWILERILGTPPPPPPLDVPELEEGEDGVSFRSLRLQLEQHRSNPDCAACHAKMDPIGLAFENFDAIGRWRDLEDNKFPIKPSGRLPSGEFFDGPRELKAILKNREGVARSLIKNMMTYALGRGLAYYDKCAIDDIFDRLVSEDYRFSALIDGIVSSEPFLMQGTEVEETQP